MSFESTYVPINVVAVFSSRKTVVQAVQELAALNLADINRAAVIARAASGEMIFVENTLSTKNARTLGKTLGAIIGALGMIKIGITLALSSLTLALAILGFGILFGAWIGGQAGRFALYLVDYKYSHQQIQTLSEHVQEGEAALVIEVDTPQSHHLLENTLKRLSGKLFQYRDSQIYH